MNEKVIKTTEVQAVDTTGAGDCWIGSFAARFVETGDVEASCMYANKAAAISVTRHGACASFPHRREVE